MNALDYALFSISLWIAGMVGALYAWRALKRKYERWKDERDTRASLMRSEEQRKKAREKWQR